VNLTDPREVPHVRVLVVDDHPAFRHALSSALEMVADIEVAGQAGGGIAACDEAEHLEPDVVIMDLSMPDLSGIDAMRRIHERRPDLPVVILTAHADDGVERAARAAGARGFLPKGTGLRDLVLALHEAAGAA
jgi:DNA-binding NarL/FixJ family response regulator